MSNLLKVNTKLNTYTKIIDISNHIGIQSGGVIFDNVSVSTTLN